YAIPHLRRLDGHAEVDLVARVGEGVKAQRLPAAAVFHRETARHDRLREDCGRLIGATWSDLGTDHTGDVALEPETVHDGEPTPTRSNIDAPAIPPAVRDHEAALRHIHDRDAAQRVTAAGVRSDEAYPGGVGRVGN